VPDLDPSAPWNRPYRKQPVCVPIARGVTADPPVLSTVDIDGRPRPVPPDEQTDYQTAAVGRYARPEVPDEVFALETFYPGAGGGSVIEVAVFGEKAELRYLETGRSDRYFARDLTADELAALLWPRPDAVAQPCDAAGGMASMRLLADCRRVLGLTDGELKSRVDDRG